MKKDFEETPATPHDRFAGATAEQRIQADEVTLNTPLEARYVGPGDGEGTAWRCQIGRFENVSGSFQRRNTDGSTETVHWKDVAFTMLGYGSTFLEAAEMARKAGHLT